MTKLLVDNVPFAGVGRAKYASIGPRAANTKVNRRAFKAGDACDANGTVGELSALTRTGWLKATACREGPTPDYSGLAKRETHLLS